MYDLCPLDDKKLDKFLFRNVEDGNWLVVSDIDVEDPEHHRVCQTFQEILAPQLFLSPPKSRFKLVLCVSSYVGFNPHLHSAVTAVAHHPLSSTSLNISFYACKCLPLMCSGALWQRGEVVGIHETTSITNPALLGSEVLDLFEAYQAYADRSLHEAGPFS